MNFSKNPLKNSLFAIGLMLFLAMCFKLTEDRERHNTSVLSPTDIVITSLKDPED